MLFLIILSIIYINSVECLNNIFHIENESETTLLTLDVNGNFDVVGNISTNGYCNCLINDVDITPSYSGQSYSPLISNGVEHWVNYTLNIGRYVVIDHFVSVQIFIHWITNDPLTDMTLPFFITLPNTPESSPLPYFTGSVGYIEGVSFSYEVNVITQNNFLTFYDIINGTPSRQIKMSDLTNQGYISVNINYLV